MAQDRLFHKRLGHSEKINQLSDFEYIVWGCYVLSADDFGVMRHSALTLQADHDRLATKSVGAIERALNKSVSLGLMHTFVHQGRKHLYQRDWQDYQKVRYPAVSSNPMPPADCLTECTTETRRIFHERAEKLSLKSDKASVNSPSPLRESSELTTGNGNANGNDLRSSEREFEGKPDPTVLAGSEISGRAAAFLEVYGELFTKHRGGAKLFRRQPALDWQRACDLCRTWDDERLSKLAEIFLTTDDDWVQRTDRGFAVFASRATWCDDRLAAWEAKRRVS